MKKTMNRLLIYYVSVCMLIAFFLTAIIHNNVSSAKVKLNKTRLSMNSGEKRKLHVIGANKKIKWTTNNKKIAKVSDGIVIAKKAGKCVIRAKVGKIILKCKVTVNKKENEKVKTTSKPSLVNSTSDSELASKIAVVIQPVIKSGTVLFTITNNNNVMINKYTLSYQFVSSSGEVVHYYDNRTVNDEKTSDEESHGFNVFDGHALSAGESQYIVLSVGKDKAGIIDAAKSTASVAVDNKSTLLTDVTDEVNVTKGQGKDSSKVPITYNNVGNSKCYVNGAVLFTDISGNIILAYSIYNTVDGGKAKFDDITIPYDTDESGTYLKDETGQNYRVQYSDVKIMFNAFRFNQMS